eukprot:Skav200297  [mRNA]  locus=scaffold2127:635085:635312:- [translate_table: standard]
MPTACGNLDAQFRRGEDAWFNKSAAARPNAASRFTCLVDESSLTKFHWELIRELLPKCRATRKQRKQNNSYSQLA